MRTADQLVNAEVIQNVSHLVAALAANCAAVTVSSESAKDLCDLTEQAQELCYPIDDWEETAIQQGAKNSEIRGWFVGSIPYTYATAQELCEELNVEPYQREVFEHWIITPWLAEQLIAKGEKVDTDFTGLNIWARTTTGQAIAIDSVIETIVAELNAKYPA